MPEPAYPWFEHVAGPDLEQGDILPNCPVIIPAFPKDLDAIVEGRGELEAEVLTGRFVIMTQACDLAHEKVESVVLCPAWTIEEMEGQDDGIRGMNSKSRRKHLEKLRRGEIPAYHMLAEWRPIQQPILVVDFHRLFTAPKPYLAAFAQARGPRARLLPPYREHLSQAFARYFMRVGLPVDIPPFV